MLELKKYTYDEMAELFGTRNNQSIQRRLNRLNITYTANDRGRRATYDITAINDPFKVYATFDLGYNPHTDFNKLTLFLYHIFNSDEFREMPDERMEHYLDNKGNHISRQSIANYIKVLEKKGILGRYFEDYVYYFANKDNQILTDEETYKKAWREYFERKEEGIGSFENIWTMREHYGGVAKKQAKIQFNAFYIPEQNAMNDMVCERIIRLSNKS